LMSRFFFFYIVFLSRRKRWGRKGEASYSLLVNICEDVGKQTLEVSIIYIMMIIILIFRFRGVCS